MAIIVWSVMRYIVELPNEKAQAIKSLVDSGKYEDTQSFILTAIENQLYLEKQPIERTVQLGFFAGKSEREESKSSLPQLAIQPDLKLSDIVTVPKPQSEVLNSEILWALYNRILPVKTTLRVLLNVMKASSNEDGYIDLITVQDAATEQARRLGRMLLQIDKKKHRIHGERLSAGFPKTRDSSGNRFKFHFVGSINSKNRLEGAPALLRFVNMRRNEQGLPQIGITKAGFQFAILENPMLDKADYSCVFSEEESGFYLKHIAENLPKEHLLSINILNAINAGRTTPDELIEVILQASSNVSKEEAQATRSSLISRLSELGLLVRKRSGLNVKYVLTQNGQEIVNTNIGKSG